MANNKDYYATLGVGESATDAEIKKAYRALAMKYHPDRSQEPAAAERFKDINEAYQTLSDPQKRREYDMLRKYGAFTGAGRPGGAGGPFGAGGFDPRGYGAPGGQTFQFDLNDLGGMGGLGDLFDTLFRGRGGRPEDEPSRDAEMTIEVPFATAAKGGTARIKLGRAEPCMACAGTGAAAGTAPKTCPQCGGRGTVTVGLGQFGVKRACPTCAGKGTVVEKPCPECRGTGSVRGRKTINVRIPAGINDGGVIRVKGEGNASPGGRVGDLLVTVRIKADARIRRDGLDTYGKLELNLAQAVLGTTAEVETTHGRVKVKVPAGIQAGKKIRIKQKGIRDERTGRTGDHYVEIDVTIPAKMTKQQKELFEQYAAAMGFGSART